ncbi:metal-dependent hydrolase [Halorubrum sp. SS7]|uniref:metal-dependent hydrolase n=1 Tax=unclassified Halorubrum TaxID=2642239 RepID=UPI0010F47166|nr:MULTISPECIES: metal-dependent hydrolase [unclassified Halorubrum]TKX52721.1 metal-dependent hydrolase [Halorubrum sp. SP3]TKX56674.1 metal-dependent hydrolase [Halorubrum sp. SS7]
MLPLGHLAFAYLWYALYAATSTHRLPARLALLPLAFGSQFPDLIDKPLAYIGVLTYGRSLAHSLFTFALCTFTVWWLATWLRGRWSAETRPERLRIVTPAAFAIGYASHLLGDTYRFLLSGDLWAARVLLYPLFPVPESPADDIAPWIRLFEIYQEMGTHPQITLIVVAIVVFVGLRVRQYLAPSQN